MQAFISTIAKSLAFSPRAMLGAFFKLIARVDGLALLFTAVSGCFLRIWSVAFFGGVLFRAK